MFEGAQKVFWHYQSNTIEKKQKYYITITVVFNFRAKRNQSRSSPFLLVQGHLRHPNRHSEHGTRSGKSHKQSNDQHRFLGARKQDNNSPHQSENQLDRGPVLHHLMVMMEVSVPFFFWTMHHVSPLYWSSF